MKQHDTTTTNRLDKTPWRMVTAKRWPLQHCFQGVQGTSAEQPYFELHSLKSGFPIDFPLNQSRYHILALLYLDNMFP
jgi:hypothetical protein